MRPVRLNRATGTMHLILSGDLRLKKQSYFASAAAVGLALLAVGCSKPPEAVATVDGTDITLDQYHRFLERMPTVKVKDRSGQVQEAQVADTLGFQAVQTLIGQQLMLELAKDEGVLPTKDEIEAELKFQEKLHDNFVTTLERSQGMTLEEIRDSLKLDRAKENLITKGIIVTVADAKQYVKDHPQQFSDPAKADLLWIVVDSKTKPTVDKDLATGQPFGSVASQYSLDKSARQTGGKYRYNIIAQMPPVLQDILAKTPEQKATDWIQDHDNWVKFYVQSKTAAAPQKLDDTKYEAVRRAIAMQRGAQASDLQKKMIDRMKVAKIQVNRPPLSDMWKAQTQALAEATANQTPTSAATPPSGASAAPTPAKK